MYIRGLVYVANKTRTARQDWPLGIFGATRPAITSGYALRTRSSINLGRAGQRRPTNPSRRVRTLFFHIQQAATSHPATWASTRATVHVQILAHHEEHSQCLIPGNDGWWLVGRDGDSRAARSFSQYYSRLTSHHSMVKRNFRAVLIRMTAGG